MDVESRGFTRHADAQGESIEPGSTMHVESRSPSHEQAIIGPARFGKYGPVDSETDQANLSAVRMSGEDEVNIIFWNMVERGRIVQQENACVAGAARAIFEKCGDLFAARFAAPVRSDQLYGPRRRFHESFGIIKQTYPGRFESRTDFGRPFVIVVAENGEALAGEAPQGRERACQCSRASGPFHGEEVAGDQHQIGVEIDQFFDPIAQPMNGLPWPQVRIGDLHNAEHACLSGLGRF